MEIISIIFVLATVSGLIIALFNIARIRKKAYERLCSQQEKLPVSEKGKLTIYCPYCGSRIVFEWDKLSDNLFIKHKERPIIVKCNECQREFQISER